MDMKIKTEDAIEFFGGRGKGGVNKLAEALGVTHGAISQYGECLPDGRAYQLHYHTKGAINEFTSRPKEAA